MGWIGDSMGWNSKSMGWIDESAAWTHENNAKKRTAMAVRFNGLTYSAQPRAGAWLSQSSMVRTVAPSVLRTWSVRRLPRRTSTSIVAFFMPGPPPRTTGKGLPSRPASR